MGYIWNDGKWEFALSTVCEPVVYHYEGADPLRWCYWWSERAEVDAWRAKEIAEINALLKARQNR